jgi:putative Mg2+ transporter-C (MgtC) family protein
MIVMDASLDMVDIALRLVTATLIGMGLGLERMLRGKPTGIRTLGLVAFAAALVALSTVYGPGGLRQNADALSRVLQGVDQGVLVGVGFLGGGILLRDPESHKIFYLTTAAEVWAVAAIGLAAACAPWAVVGMAVAIFVLLIVVFRVLEKQFHLKD